MNINLFRNEYFRNLKQIRKYNFFFSAINISEDDVYANPSYFLPADFKFVYNNR